MKPTRVYPYAGPVDRVRDRCDAIKPSLERYRTSGYRAAHGAVLTRQECLEEARRDGVRAVFNNNLGD